MIVIKNISNKFSAKKINKRAKYVSNVGGLIYVKFGDKVIPPGKQKAVALNSDDPRIKDLLDCGIIQIVSDNSEVYFYGVAATHDFNEPVVNSKPTKVVPGPPPSVVSTVEDISNFLVGKSLKELKTLVENLGGTVPKKYKKDDLIKIIKSIVE
jgi:hypothetical protein